MPTSSCHWPRRQIPTPRVNQSLPRKTPTIPVCPLTPSVLTPLWQVERLTARPFLGRLRSILLLLAEPFLALPPCARHSMDSITRSEEHTSELQSQFHLVCRLL